MRKGFTLAEVAVATVIILVVLSALAVALVSFVRGGRKLELQEGAATLARVEIVNIERSAALPPAGVSSRPDSLMGNAYTVKTTVLSYTENTADVTVEVSSGDSVAVGFSRRFYEDGLQ